MTLPLIFSCDFGHDTWSIKYRMLIKMDSEVLITASLLCSVCRREMEKEKEVREEK